MHLRQRIFPKIFPKSYRPERLFTQTIESVWSLTLMEAALLTVEGGQEVRDRLLARLYRGRHLRRQRSTHLQGATLTVPDVQISRIRFLTGELGSWPGHNDG